MLYDLVAEHFGLVNDINLQTAVDASGTSILDWLDGKPSPKVRKLVLEAFNKQTDVMIEKEMANPQSIIDLLNHLRQIQGVTISNFPNRKARRAAAKQENNS